MKKHILLFCILTVFFQNVQLSGQDFDEYKFCSKTAIDDVDTYKNKGSGIAFNPVDSTYLICLSSPEALYVVDMDGTLLSTNPLVGFADVEGLEIMNDSTFVLVEEFGRGNIVFLPLPIPTNQSIYYPDSTQIIHCLDSTLIFQCTEANEIIPCSSTNQNMVCTEANQIIECGHPNNGFESIAYDATNDVLYWATETRYVYSLENPLSYASQNNTLFPTSPWDMREKLNAALIEFTGYDRDDYYGYLWSNRDLIDEDTFDLYEDIYHFTNISGMHFSSSNTLWIANGDRNVMIEVEPTTGDVLQVFDYNGDNYLNTIQGITEGPSGEIVIIEHWSLFMNKFDDECVVYNDCPADESVFFDFEQGMDLCNIEEVNFLHWRRQQQAWIDYDDDEEYAVTKIEGAANGDYYFLLDETHPFRDLDKEYFAEGSEIDLAGIVDPIVKFDYILDNFIIELHISEDDGSNWETVWAETDPYSDETTFPLAWNQIIIPLDNYINQKIKFRFKVIQEGVSQYINAPGISALDAIEFRSGTDLPCNDADNDGTCAEDDCDDNNPNIPATPGTSCDDGNPDTFDDFIQADGCTCAGYYSCEPFYELSGTINSGIFTAQDYIESDGEVPASSTVVFSAGNRVDLLPGFDADSNTDTDFTAEINQLCPTNKQVSERELTTIRNYPNPFTGLTTIEFTLPEDGPVTLWVTDAMGKQITVLKDSEPTLAGTHTVNFDGSRHAAGIYYYTIQAREYVGTQKMVLVK